MLQLEPVTASRYRNTPPAHYLMRINSFQRLLESSLRVVESQAFEVGQFRWILQLFLWGDLDEKQDHLALYLRMVDGQMLPYGLDIRVISNFFLYSHINNSYLVLENAYDGWKYTCMESNWGVRRLISHDNLLQESNGFVRNDSLRIGVELVAARPRPEKMESFTYRVNQQDNMFSFNYNTIAPTASIDICYEGYSWNLKMAREEPLTDHVEVTLKRLIDNSPNSKVFLSIVITLQDKNETGVIPSVKDSGWMIKDGHTTYDLVAKDQLEKYMIHDTVEVQLEFESILAVREYENQL